MAANVRAFPVAFHLPSQEGRHSLPIYSQPIRPWQRLASTGAVKAGANRYDGSNATRLSLDYFAVIRGRGSRGAS